MKSPIGHGRVENVDEPVTESNAMSTMPRSPKYALGTSLETACGKNIENSPRNDRPTPVASGRNWLGEKRLSTWTTVATSRHTAKVETPYRARNAGPGRLTNPSMS